MRPLIFTFLFLAGLGFPAFLHADACAWSSGGYCVSFLVQKTTEVIATLSGDTILNSELSVVSPDIPDSPSGTECYLAYEAIWTEWTRTGLATAEEKREAFDEAMLAGGTKIGGMNLVVLGARTLQKLVDLKGMTLEQAQKILNDSKKEKL